MFRQILPLLGLLAGFALGSPATAAQPGDPAVVPSAEDYETVVYFDYGRNDLGEAGLLLVREVAAKALSAGFDHAEVVGHTDKAGSAEQNLKDGLERAEAVAFVLIAAGYDPDNVEVDSAGESEPARKHDDDRREPLNRRAVITFSEG